MKLRYLILGATLLAVPAQAGQWRDGRYWPDPPNRGGHADLRGEWADLTQSNEAIADGCQSEDATIKGPWPDRHLDRPDCVAVHLYVTCYTEGLAAILFTSMTAPVASGWSGCRVGLAPTGKRPALLNGAHVNRSLRVDRFDRAYRREHCVSRLVGQRAPSGRGVPEGPAQMQGGGAWRS